MEMGTDSARGRTLGAALMPTAATKREMMDLVCILVGVLERRWKLAKEWLLVCMLEVEWMRCWMKT
jgi:hypothetical protein